MGAWVELASDRGAGRPAWQRRKGMHHATRERLLAGIIECEEMRDKALCEFAARIGLFDCL